MVSCSSRKSTLIHRSVIERNNVITYESRANERTSAQLCAYTINITRPTVWLFVHFSFLFYVTLAVFPYNAHMFGSRMNLPHKQSYSSYIFVVNPYNCSVPFDSIESKQNRIETCCVIVIRPLLRICLPSLFSCNNGSGSNSSNYVGLFVFVTTSTLNCLSQ